MIGAAIEYDLIYTFELFPGLFTSIYFAISSKKFNYLSILSSSLKWTLEKFDKQRDASVVERAEA